MVSGRTKLSAETHELARRAQAGEHGRTMRPAEFSLDEAGALAGLSPEMRYAHAVKLIAERAPLRVLDGERIVGSATLLEAAHHMTPVLGAPSTSHTTLGFDRALRVGYRGLREQVRSRLARGGLDEKGRDLLEAMLVCLDAAGTWHRRHVELLERRVAEARGAARATYERVLAALRPVPEEPPRTFHEAVQALWMLYAFQRLCGTWSGLGRVDEMLGPHLAADLAAGRLDLDEARELIAHFWIKGCEWIGADTPHVGTSGDAQFYQNVVLGGVDADGRDVTNAVTYLVLDVVEELRISDFPIAVRIGPESPEELLRRLAAVQRRGGGIVAVYNEPVVLRALERFGYDAREARRFANDGCWELIIPGRTCFAYRPFDALPCLQEALGVTGDSPPPPHATFEDLYAAFRGRLAAAVEAVQAEADDFARAGPAAPLVSLLVEDCIERARGYWDRGARYTVRAPHAGGLPDVANALLAVRRLVYETGELSLGELVGALRDDWAGRDTLRRRVRSRFTFYGNADPQADAMVRRVFDDYVALVEQVPSRAGVLRPAGLSTFGRQIEWADGRGATAAGTRRGEYLASNFSPAPGTDRCGPTAAVRSFCAVDFERLPNGTALDLKIHPASVRGEAGLEALAGLLRGFVRLGGIFLHVDVVDSALLREAQANPDRYPNLAVRISGWSARFATLSREWQDMIIRRTEHELR